MSKDSGGLFDCCVDWFWVLVRYALRECREIRTDLIYTPFSGPPVSNTTGSEVRWTLQWTKRGSIRLPVCDRDGRRWCWVDNIQVRVNTTGRAQPRKEVACYYYQRDCECRRGSTREVAQCRETYHILTSSALKSSRWAPPSKLVYQESKWVCAKGSIVRMSSALQAMTGTTMIRTKYTLLPMSQHGLQMVLSPFFLIWQALIVQ